MNTNQYFSSSVVPEKLGKCVVVSERYSAHQQKTIGVFTGTESVCVINTGMGMNGSLRSYIESVVGTDKTIECVCLTGSETDTGAAALFDAAYLNEAQLPKYQQQGSDPEQRMKTFQRLSHNSAESIQYGEKLMYDNSGVSFKNASDGMSSNGMMVKGIHKFDNAGEGRDFHLGGTVVQIGELPAQSKGQLIAFSPTLYIAFVGDAVEELTHLENLDREGMNAYVEGLERLISALVTESKFAEGMPKTPPAIYGNHSPEPMKIDVLQNVLAACKEVLDGQTAHDAPAGDKPNQRMHLVHNNGIVYDRERIG